MSVPLNPTSLDEELIAECLSILGKVWPAESAEGSTSSPDQAGETLPGDSDHLAFGRFRLLETRGRGGYGVVFRAHDSRLRREVALKIPRPDVLTTRATRTRFLREAQAAAALDHPNIVGVLEAAEEGQLWYIVTAYCSGPTLAEWLAEQSAPVDLRAAAALVANLADGVAHAHFRGVLHRDLKPSNVLLDPIPDSTAAGLSAYSPRVADFGLAKRADAMEDETQTGTVLGTLQYMSPEQAAGRVREIGVASDIYSLGAILYEMLCGQPPHVGGSDLDLLRKVAEELPRSPRQRRPEISRDLDTVCMKCLEKSPAARYQTVVELADDLRCVVSGEPVAARSIGAAHRLGRWIRRRPIVSALSGALVATLIVGVASVVWFWRDSQRNLSLATTHSQAAEKNLAEAEEYLVRMSLILDESWFWREPYFTSDPDFRSKLANDLASVLRQRRGRDGISPAARAAGLWRLGYESYEANDFAAGERMAKESLSNWRKVLHAHPDHHTYRRSAALTLYFLTTYGQSAGKPLEFLQLESGELLPGFDWANMVDVQLAEDLARLLQERAEAIEGVGSLQAARATHCTSSHLWAQLMQRFPDRVRYRVQYATEHGEMGFCDAADHNDRRAATELLQAAELIEPLLATTKNASGTLSHYLAFQQAAATCLNRCSLRTEALRCMDTTLTLVRESRAWRKLGPKKQAELLKELEVTRETITTEAEE